MGERRGPFGYTRTQAIEAIMRGEHEHVERLIVVDVRTDVVPSVMGEALDGTAYRLAVERTGPRSVSRILDGLRHRMAFAALDPQAPPRPPCSLLLAETRTGESLADFLLIEATDGSGLHGRRWLDDVIGLDGLGAGFFHIGGRIVATRNEVSYEEAARAATERVELPRRYGPDDGFDYSQVDPDA